MTFALILAGFITTATWPAQGAIYVNVNSVTYQVTDVLTTFSADQALLESQPEWGSVNETIQLAHEVGYQLGVPNIPESAPPFFAFSYSAPYPEIAWALGNDVAYSPNEIPDSTPAYYAILTAVPEPSMSAMMITLLPLLGLGMRKRGD